MIFDVGDKLTIKAETKYVFTKDTEAKIIKLKKNLNNEEIVLVETVEGERLWFRGSDMKRYRSVK